MISITTVPYSDSRRRVYGKGERTRVMVRDLFTLAWPDVPRTWTKVSITTEVDDRAMARASKVPSIHVELIEAA